MEYFRELLSLTDIRSLVVLLGGLEDALHLHAFQFVYHLDKMFITWKKMFNTRIFSSLRKNNQQEEKKLSLGKNENESDMT